MLTMEVRENDNGVVTGYSIFGDQTTMNEQCTVLTHALERMVPLSTHHNTSSAFCNAAAAICMQLAVLMERPDMSKYRRTIDVLSRMHFYLWSRRRVLMDEDPSLTEEEAGRRLIPSYDYFGIDWATIFRHDPT